LPAFVLFERTDAEIAKDYATYRTVDRDGLRRYVAQFWCGLDLSPREETEPAAPAVEAN